jgi:hypothetical protein
MRLGSACLVLVAGFCVLVGMSGCDWNETGFVEIKRGVNLPSDDVLILNSTEIANLAQKDHLIIQERVGRTSLQLKRGENNQKLCDLEIKKNRVVTVTVTYVNATIRCTVQS